jgi:hypothetical protein
MIMTRFCGSFFGFFFCGKYVEFHIYKTGKFYIGELKRETRDRVDNFPLLILHVPTNNVEKKELGFWSQ